MRNYCEMMWKAGRYVVLLVAAAVTGCTAVNDELGFSLIPGDQQMAIAIDSLYGFDTYLVRTDSIPAHSRGIVILGSRQDPTFGRTSGKAVMQFSPDSFLDSDAKFGPEDQTLTPDSIVLYLLVNNTKGDTTRLQEFEIFELNEPIHYSTTYFIDYDPASLFDESKPLFSFTHRGPGDMVVVRKDTPAENPALGDFMQRLIDLAYDRESAYITSDSISNLDRDSIFHLKFRGLHIRPTSSSPTDAALYSVDPSNTYTIENASGTTYLWSHMTLYSHYTTKTDDDRDSTVVSYHQYTFATNTYTLNTSISMIAHDYSGSTLDGQINTTDDPKALGPVNTAYVETLGGVYTCISIQKDQLLADIERFKTNKGVTYRDIVVNQARLEILMDDRTVDNMNNAPGRMGMYYDYQWLWRTSALSGSTGNMPLVLDDYMYELESSYTIPFDGNLNRSRGLYNMDISSYVQQLLKDPEATQKDIYLAPDVSWTFNMRDVALKSPDTGEDRIRLILTYTLVK